MGRTFDELVMGTNINPSATHLLITAPSSVATGMHFNITVTALDANNNVATGYTGTVHFTSSDGKAVLPANYKFTATDRGVHTFTNGFELATLGSQTVSARGIIATIAGTSGTITVKQHYLITVNSAYGDPTPSTWVAQGSSFTASVTSPADVQGSHRYLCTGFIMDGVAYSSGTSFVFSNVQSAHTITFKWKEQFYATSRRSGSRAKR